MMDKKIKKDIIRYPFRPLFGSHFIWIGWFMLFTGIIYLAVYLSNPKDAGYHIFGLFIIMFLIMGGILIIKQRAKK